MPAEAVSIATEVTAMIEAAKTALSQSQFLLERSYADWDQPLETAPLEMPDLRVDVVANSVTQETELATRGKSRFRVPIDIAIRKKLGIDQQDDTTGQLEVSVVDDLIYFSQQVHQLFVPQRLTNFQSAVWKETKTLAMPIRKHLREMRQFTAIVRITFESVVDL